MNWRDINSVDLEKSSLSQNDYIHALVMKKQWDTILGFAETNSKVFLKCLHIPPVKKNIFNNLDENRLLTLLERSIEPVRSMIFNILTEFADSKPYIQDVAMTLLHNSAKYPFIVDHAAQVVLLLPLDKIKKAFTTRAAGEGKTVYEIILATIDGEDAIEGEYINLNPSPRVLSKRPSIIGVVFDLFEEIVKSDSYISYDSNIMEYIQSYYPTYSKIPALKARLQKIVISACPEKIICKKTYQFLIDGTLPVPYNFDLSFFLEHKMVTLEQITEMIIQALAKDAELPSIKGTNLSRYIKNLPNISSYPMKNMLLTIRSIAREDPNSNYGKIWSRIEKDYENAAAKMLINHGDASLIEFISSALKYTNLYSNKYASDYSIIFSAEKSLEIIKNVITRVISSKDKIILSSSQAYTDRMFSIAKAIGCVIEYYDDAFHDDFFVEMFRHPTNLDKPNYVYEKDTIQGLLCAINVRDPKKMSGIFVPKDKTDEYGFLTNRKIVFPPLPSSITKKTEDYECKTIHPIETSIIQCRLLVNKNTNVSSAAKKLYLSFVNKMLQMALKNPDLASRASEMHFRFCRYCIRDDHEIIGEEICNPAALAAAAKAQDGSIEKLIEMAPNADGIFAMLLGRLLTTRNEMLKDAEDYAVKLVPSVLQKMYEIEQIDHLNFPNIELSYPVNLENTKKVVNSVHNITAPKKFRNMIIKAYMSSATKVPFLFEHDLKPLYYENNETRKLIVRLSSKVLMAVFRNIYQVAQDFKPIAPGSEPSHKFTAVFNLFDRLKNLLTRNTRSVTPFVKNFWEFAKKFGKKASDKYSNGIQYEFNLPITEATYPIFKVCYPDSLLGSLTDDSDLFTILNFFTNYDPYLNSVTAQENEDLNKQPSIFKLNFEATVDVDTNLGRILNNHDYINSLKPASQKSNYSGYTTEFFSTMMQRILTLDPEKTLKLLIQYPGSFVAFAGLLSRLADHCPEVKGSTKLIELMLDTVFKDLTVVDPEPTEEEPNPIHSETIFTKYQNKMKTRRPKKNGRKKGASDSKDFTNASDKRFSMNLALIAKLCSILRAPCFASKVNIGTFTDSLNQVLRLPPDIITQRLGDNENVVHNWSAQLADLIVYNLDFGKDTKPADWAKTMDKKFDTYGRMFGVPALLHQTLAATLDKFSLMQHLEERCALMSALASMTELSMHDETFAPGVGFRMKTICWCLSPEVLGYPLPQFSVDYIKRISTNENLSIDMVRTISSCIVSYFQSQSLIGMKPAQFDDFFEVFKNMNTPKFNLLIPHMARLIFRDSCKLFGYCEDILPSSADPDEVVFNPICSIVEMPSKGEWFPLQTKLCASLVAQGILSKNEKIAQLTMKVLTSASGVASISEIVAPRVIYLLKNYSVQGGITCALEFAVSFVFEPQNAKYTEAVDAFIGLMESVNKQVSERLDNLAQSIWLNSIDESKFNGLKHFYETVNNCINGILVNLDSKGAKYVSEIMKRLIPNGICDNDLLPIQSPKTFMIVTRFMAFPKIEKLYETDIDALFEFIEEMKDYLYAMPTFTNMIFWNHANLFDEEVLKKSAKLSDAAVSKTNFFAHMTADLFHRLHVKGTDIKDLLPFAHRFIGKATSNFDQVGAPSNVKEGSLAEHYEAEIIIYNDRQKGVKAEQGTTKQIQTKSSGKSGNAPEPPSFDWNAASNVQINQQVTVSFANIFNIKL